MVNMAELIEKDKKHILSIEEIKEQMKTHSKVEIIFKSIMSKEYKEDFAKKYNAVIVRIEPHSMNSMVITIPKNKLEILKKTSNIKNVLVFW
jgi:predicted nucleic acid-binding OB-fold protein